MKIELQYINLCSYGGALLLHNFSANFSALANCALRLIFTAGTLFANANGERMGGGADYQVLGICVIDDEVVDVKPYTPHYENVVILALLSNSRNKNRSPWLGCSK